MTPPLHHKTIAKHVAAAWDRPPRVLEMSAKGTSHMQAIAQLADWPEPGFVSYATIGLSDHGGVELSGAATTRHKSFIKALFDVASYVAAGHRALHAGATFEKVVARYYSKSDVAHLVIRSKTPAGTGIAPLSLPSGRVHWLHAWAITSDELVWLQGKGKQKLGPLLDRAGTSACDLGRHSLDGVPAFDPWAVPKQRR